MANSSKKALWSDKEIIILKRSAKWVVGVIVQENPDGSIRLKLFKGAIKENGTREVRYKGKIIRFSMVQRFNIPSLKYWEALCSSVNKIFKYNVKKIQRSLDEFS